VGQLLVVSLSAFTFKLHQNWSLIHCVSEQYALTRCNGSGIRAL